MEPGLYIETKPVRVRGAETGFYHAYIVYRKPDGTAEVIRGGPESLLAVPFGADLAVEAGVPLAESDDAYKGDDSPETRRARRIDLKGRDPEIVWGQMTAAAKKIGEAGIDYNLAPMQNSNSLIRHVFEAAALDPGEAFPDDYSPRAHPGFDNDLRDALHGPGAPDPDAAPGRAKGPDDGLRGWSDPVEPPRYPARDRKQRRERAPDGADAPPEAPSAAPATGSDRRSEAPAAREASAAASVPMDAGLRERAARELAAIPELEGIQLKPPADWTEGEMRRLLRDPLYWDGPEPDRVALRDGVAGWFAARYGTAPARRDGTGRMVEPAFQKTPLAEAVEPRTPDHVPLDRALAGVADALGRAGAAVGPTQAVRRFQGGLNRLSAALTAAEPARPSRTSAPKREPGAAFYEEAADRARPRIGRLKEDGIFGPKTAKATRAALTRAGRAPVERAAAGAAPASPAASDPGDAYNPSKPARPSAFGPSPLAERTRGRRVLSVLED